MGLTAERLGVRAAAATAPVAPAVPLLTTKFAVPRLRAELVPRPRLLAHLDAGLAGPLTLVSAPAGSGKSTLLAEWLRGRAGDGGRLAWLSLEPADDEPVRFFTYATAALQRADPGLGETALSLLQSPRPRSRWSWRC